MSQYSDGAWLDNILPEYENIANAPDYETLYELALEEGRHISEIMCEEGKKLYKSATHLEKGRANVQLVQNPALMTFQAAIGCTHIHRQPPQDLGPARNFKEG